MRTLRWMLAVFGLSLFTIFLSEARALDPFQNLSLTVATPLQDGLRQVAQPTADFFDGIFNRGDLARENRELREELEALQAERVAAMDAEQRVRELEQALEVRQTRPEDELLVADVIAQDPSGFKRALAINRGSSDGLDEGMVVLSKSGSLVGTVSLVYDDFAWIRLVSDPNAAVNVAVLPEDEETAEVRGVAVGGLRSTLSMELLPADAEIAEGDLVATSGLGGNFPRALPVGKIVSVENQPQALSTKATMEPAADLNALDTVLIITNFQPARLSSQ